MDYAEHGAVRKLAPDLEPWVDLFPGPAVHPDLAALPALATADEDRAAVSVEIRFNQGACFADAQTCAPEHDDQPAEPQAIGTIACGVHYSDDLLDGRRVARIAQPFVAWRTTVFRDGPFRFFFFSREEERLHIHVQSADGEAKVWIEPEIELAKNYELSDQDLSRVLQLVRDHEQEIRDAWHRHFDS